MTTSHTSAGDGTLSANEVQTGIALPLDSEAAEIERNGDELPPEGLRLRLACRAAADIMDVVGLIVKTPRLDLTEAVLEMIERRIHDLAGAILSALDDPNETSHGIRCRVFPISGETV